MIDEEGNGELPFLESPCGFPFGPNIYNQALKVYISQCRKSEVVKEGMRQVHKDRIYGKTRRYQY